MKNRRTFSFLLLAIATVGVTCKKSQPVTEVILEIGTNIPVPSGMDAIILRIAAPSSGEFFNRTYGLGTGANQIVLPRRMTLTPSSAGTTMTVSVDGLLNGAAIVSRVAVTGFVQGESRLLRIDLLDDCVRVVCNPGQTCMAGGTCVDGNIDPLTLPKFDPKQDPVPAPLDADAGTAPDGASDVASADGPNAAGRDVGAYLGDAALDRIAGPAPPSDGPAASDGLIPTDGQGPDVPAASKPNGTTCDSKAECQSNICVDGFCCNSACSGSCTSCKVPGNLGICSLVPLNDPSDGDCPDDGVQTCGGNGKCDGAGGCMLYPSGAVCSPRTCPAGSSTHTRPGLCDGQGHCGAGQVLDCAPFVCNATTTICFAACSAGGGECQPPNLCVNGSCGKKSNGQSCTTPTECTSNFCEQGVCCGGPCQGLCTSCAVDGLLGTCSPVKLGQPDPQSRCKDQGAVTCGSNGACDGSGACQNYAAGLLCQSSCDAKTGIFSSSTCSGSGTCGLSPNTACAPYNCDAKGCRKACLGPAGCAPGNVCSPSGTCVPSSVEDCTNGIDDDGNGLIDCADPACTAGFMCVPAVPAGFTGPGEVFDGPGTSPPCDPQYTKDYLAGYATPQCPVSCGTCTCGSPTGVTCTNPRFLIGTATSKCAGGVILADGCNAIDSGATNYATTAGVASGGSCTIVPGTPSIPPVTSNTGHLCSGSAKGGLGCQTGYVCWPKPQTPFLPQACVFASGDLTCPSTGYTAKRSYYDSPNAKDTRACTSSCGGCDTVSGATCKASIYFSTRTACLVGGRPDLIAVPSACQALPVNVPAGVPNVSPTAATVTGGSCTPTGTMTPAGGCVPTGNPTTACCAP